MIAASLREDVRLVAVAFLGRVAAVIARGVPALRVLPTDDLAAAARAVGFFAVVRRVAAGAVPVLLRVAAAPRVPRTAVPVEREEVRVDAGAPVPVVLRAVAPRPVTVRVVAVRLAGVRNAAVRPLAVRFVAAGVFVVAVARVFLVGALAATVFAAAALVVLAAEALVVRAVFAGADEGLAARVAFAMAFGATFFVAGLPVVAERFAAVERAGAVVLARFVWAVLPRGLVPALRRPPARTAIARLRGPSWLLSPVMLNLLFLEDDGEGGEDRRPCRDDGTHAADQAGPAPASSGSRDRESSGWALAALTVSLP